jgi:hypothetical protein
MIDLYPKSRTLEYITRNRDLERSYVVYYRGGDWWTDRELMIEWASAQFGPRNDKFNNPRWKTGPFEFRFKYEKDAMMFMLRWS